MTESQQSKAAVGRLSVLVIGGCIVFTMNPDGSDRKDLVTGCKTPAGVPVDVAAGHIYCTNMGPPQSYNGSIDWCDREGMRVMRSNLDGSQIETLVDSSQGDARPGLDQEKWCVVIAVDFGRGRFYWSQKGLERRGAGEYLPRGLGNAQGRDRSYT